MRKRLMLMLAICLVGSTAACGQETGGERAAADVITPTGAAEVGGPGETQLPRSVRYAGMTWTIMAAATEGSTVQLDFTVENSLDQDVTHSASILALVHAGDPLVRAENVLVESESHNLLQVGAGKQVTGTARFEPPGPVDLSAVSFTIDVEGETPALLPLSGPLPPDPYPLVGTASGESGSIPDWEGAEAEVVVRAMTAAAGLDYGADRAPRGAMFVIVGLRVFGVAGTGGGRVNDEFFRLHAGGTDVGPRENFNTKVAPGTSKDIELAFSVPLGTTSMTLLAGQDGTQAATFAVTIPLPS